VLLRTGTHVPVNAPLIPTLVCFPTVRWDAVHLKKTEKVPFSKENPGARAALLSGPPGIGKSTVAALAAMEGGYDVSLPMLLCSGAAW
jgi:Mrp family chromosome partitioning ATPase